MLADEARTRGFGYESGTDAAVRVERERAYFVGVAGANSFAPVSRFAFGANFTQMFVTRPVPGYADTGNVGQRSVIWPLS